MFMLKCGVGRIQDKLFFYKFRYKTKIKILRDQRDGRGRENLKRREEK